MSLGVPLRVLVVDDHPGIRAGIANLIDSERPRMCSVGAVATADEAVVQTRLQQPHVIVLDVNLAGEDGLALIPALQRAAPCEIVVLTSLADPQVEVHARRLGARACLNKTAPALDLLACIASLHGIDGVLHAAAPLNAGVGVSYGERIKHPLPGGDCSDAELGTAV